MEAEKALRGIIEQLPEDDPQREILLPHLQEIQVRAQLDFLDFNQFPKTEAEVKTELARQAGRYIDFGLNKHPQIKMSRGKFKDSLIALAALRPEKFADGLSLPLAVLGQVPAKDVYVAAGFDYYLGGLGVGDWPDGPQSYRTPQGLYLARMVNTGVDNLGRKVADVRANLPADIRGATLADGSGLIVAHSGILKHHYLDLPGTSVKRGHAPYLGLFDGRPGVYYRRVDYARSGFGSAFCRRD